MDHEVNSALCSFAFLYHKSHQMFQQIITEKLTAELWTLVKALKRIISSFTLRIGNLDQNLYIASVIENKCNFQK